MTPSTVTVAALQTSYCDDMQDNIEKTVSLIRAAAAKGANIILPSELFQGLYFCTAQEEKWFDTAYSVDEHPCVRALAPLAKELGVVLPVSIFEKAGPEYYNSVVILDADGTNLGTYRKSHIPDGPGYQEKYYFKPGDTGFKVWDTAFAKIGVGICWDQWFPEAARAMMLQGAELLFYPTAIGSEPYDAALDTSESWRTAMRGHAVSNAVPVIAANRYGREAANGPESTQDFYGHSFIADHTGAVVQALDRPEDGALLHSFDLEEIRAYRASWGFFRDRRPELYKL
jgi:N-carbamoylputrescine amidase